MSTSPIDVLDDDTFLSIFDMITSQIPRPEVRRIDRPLATIRAASQVCRQWRDVMLSSPWIWGRLIDLQEIYCAQGIEWMEEVARRSGLAPLWIYGNVKAPSHFLSSNTQKYFIQWLESWERMERLSVIIHSTDNRILADILIRFLSRAPILKSFHVHFSATKGPSPIFLDTLLPGSSQRLFADYAPSLRVIRASQMAYRSDSSWLPNIREIRPFPKYLTLEDIFVILQRTPAIKRISIQNRDILWVQPPCSNVSLPNLSSISLETSLTVFAGMLDHITPGILSGFSAHIQEPEAEGLARDQSFILSSFKKNLPAYLSNYFAANAPTTLWLAITRRGLRLCDFTADLHSKDTDHFELFIIINYRDQHDWDNLVACLLDTFTAATILKGKSSLFESVTELTMDCKEVEVELTLIPKLYSMLIILRHVQDIYVDEAYVGILISVSLTRRNEAVNLAEHILFPQLHTLHLTSIGPRDSIFQPDLRSLFVQRKKIGFPITRLDVTRCQESTDLRYLEGVGGLEVVWKKPENEPGREEIHSYICGTGEPDRLNILIRPRRWD